MKFNLQKRVALVSGGSQGIGLEIAKTLATEGANIALFAKEADALQKAKKEIEALGVEVLTVADDAMQPNTIEVAVEKVIQQMGKVDILINNIGFTGRLVTFENLDLTEWESIMRLNIISAVRFTKSVLPVMKQQHWGRIIFVASESAVQPDAEMPHYNLTKAGLLALSKSLANDLGENGITVNSVSPGPTVTPLWEKLAAEKNMPLDEFVKQFAESGARKLPMGRFGKPSDIAPVVAFLCSEQAGWITGSNYRVDGGSVKHI